MDKRDICPDFTVNILLIKYPCCAAVHMRTMLFGFRGYLKKGKHEVGSWICCGVYGESWSVEVWVLYACIKYAINKKVKKNIWVCAAGK